MGKTYIDTVKYVVHADLEIDGIVEKPDVVGAIFGQTEGLLGDELDLRELQKSGRIGRIEVNINTKAGKSVGEIVLPSSLDRVETAILSAALETVDRVGPCEAKIKVKTIEDTRTIKRDQVVNRAKSLLKGMMSEIMPERKEISELVREEVKLADVQLYGPEKLAAGPNIDDADHIIVVEGRADVLTMLKADIRNVISLQGKVVPKTIMDLSHKKSMTVFVDGDRGGDLIIKQLADCAEIDFVAKAPDGKEVEELTKKEIIKCLRNKLPFEQFMTKTFKEYKPETRERTFERPRFEERRPLFKRPEAAHAESAQENAEEQKKEIPEQQNPYSDKLKELEGTLRGVIIDLAGNILSESDVKDLSKNMEKTEGAEAVVFDGIITQRLVDIANKANIKTLVGVKSSRIDNKGNVKIYTK
ncbi:MAG: DNA primase DnaG [archaeon]